MIYICLILFCNALVAQNLGDAINQMAKRAKLMKLVAASKWYQNPDQSVYDAQQEVKVLQNTQQVAKQYKFDAPALQVFVQIQMDVSKQIEYYWIAYWNDPETPEDQLPKKKDIISLDKLRTEITQIDQKLFLLIHNSLPDIHQTPNNQLIRQLHQSFINNENEPIKCIPEHPDFLLLFANSLNNISQTSD